jgi:hypothetical protein
MGTTRYREVRPTVGFTPTRLPRCEGETMEPDVCVRVSFWHLICKEYGGQGTNLSAESGKSQADGRSDATTAGAAAGVLVRVVGAGDLSAVCRPAVGGVAAAVVGPLTEIGLGQDDGTGLAQFGCHGAVAGDLGADKGE